jgi:TATA-box binding protein (TBP) (component of TFIID and TFIIIB)
MLKNIKLSVICEVAENWRKQLKHCLTRGLISFKEKGNIFIIKEEVTLCIFQKKETFDKTLIHLNISGVKTFENINQIILKIKKNYFQYNCIVISVKVDNTTSVFQYPQKVNLDFFKKCFCLSKFDKERFPGLFYKLEHGTAIIFKSGKVNILGCKSKDQILSTWKEIMNMLNYATMKECI